MLIKKQDRKEIKRSEAVTIFEYELTSKGLGFAIAKINGKFPKTGWTMNTVCEGIYYILKGTGTLLLDNKEIKLEPGDVYLIEPNKKYCIIGENLELAEPTSPAWYPEQQEFTK